MRSVRPPSQDRRRKKPTFHRLGVLRGSSCPRAGVERWSESERQQARLAVAETRGGAMTIGAGHVARTGQQRIEEQVAAEVYLPRRITVRHGRQGGAQPTLAGEAGKLPVEADELAAAGLLDKAGGAGIAERDRGRAGVNIQQGQQRQHYSREPQPGAAAHQSAAAFLGVRPSTWRATASRVFSGR